MKVYIDGIETTIQSATYMDGIGLTLTTKPVAVPKPVPPQIITQAMLDSTTLVFMESWSNAKIGGPGGVWARNMANPDIRFHQANHEAQAWVYPQSPAGITFNPYTVSSAGGYVNIKARAATDAERKLVWGQPILSGMLANWPVMAKVYGYFEVEASWNTIPGKWPAAWLLKYNPSEDQPQPGTSWPPEIDIMEHVPSLGLGKVHINTWWQDAVSGISSSGGPVEIPPNPQSSGLIGTRNKYSVLWTKDFVAHYINRVLVGVVENKGLHEPMHLILDLAWGGEGSWPGNTDLTQLPADTGVYFGRIGVWEVPQGM